MTDVRVLLAKNMKNFREILGISQMELAEKIGCSPTLIGKIETMKRFPSADTINRLINTLKIAPSDLFKDTSNSEAVKTIINKQKNKNLLKSKINKTIDEFFS